MGSTSYGASIGSDLNAVERSSILYLVISDINVLSWAWSWSLSSRMRSLVVSIPKGVKNAILCGPSRVSCWEINEWRVEARFPNYFVDS